MTETLFSKKSINRFLLRIFVGIDQLCYRAISRLAIIANGGTHPKHAILRYADFFLSKVPEGASVIDVGCGKGETAYHVAQKAGTVTGIDMNEKNIAKAQVKYSRPNISFVVGDATVYPVEKKFDVIILSNVLEHIEDRIPFLRRLQGLSGRMLLRVPMIDRDWLAVYKKEHGLEYRLDRTHYIEYTLPILTQELAEAGWKIESYSIQFGEFWGVITVSL